VTVTGGLSIIFDNRSTFGVSVPTRRERSRVEARPARPVSKPLARRRAAGKFLPARTSRPRNTSKSPLNPAYRDYCMAPIEVLPR
jgi:hypothetical protein